MLMIVLTTGCGGTGEASPDTAETPTGEADIVVSEVGFATPESVLHDPEHDVYYVSNISGDPTAADGDGFISRLSPDGEVLELRWIDGTTADVTLNAPKGMAIQGSSLFVTDLDCVRIFDRATGAASGEVCVPEATFLNDIAPDDQGTLFVTDTGFGPGFEPSGTDAVYRLSRDGRMAAIAEGEWLGHPNGVAVGSRGIFVVTFGSGEVIQLAVDGSHTRVMPESDRQLDGVEFLDDGGFVFSSWGDQAVYRVAGDGSVSRVLENVDAPADIGVDRTRNRLLVPLFNQNQVVIHSMN